MCQGASPGLQETLLLRPWQGVAERKAQLLNWLQLANRRSSAPVLLPCTSLLLLPLVTLSRCRHPQRLAQASSIVMPACCSDVQDICSPPAYRSMNARQGVARPA